MWWDLRLEGCSSYQGGTRAEAGGTAGATNKASELGVGGGRQRCGRPLGRPESHSEGGIRESERQSLTPRSLGRKEEQACHPPAPDTTRGVERERNIRGNACMKLWPLEETGP